MGPAPLLGATELSKALIEAGNNLLKPHLPTETILSSLNKLDFLLSTVHQDPSESLQKALIPSAKALASNHLLKNSDSDIRVSVVSCLTEIVRITAPEAPYNDEQMKEYFKGTIEAFGKLADASCLSYGKAEIVLDTVAKVRSSIVMLDMECDDLVLEMIQQFLKIISPDLSPRVVSSMETIMNTVIDESEELSMDLLDILLTAVKKESLDVKPTATKLVERVLTSCGNKLQPYITEALKIKGTSLDMYSPVVSSVCQTESVTTTQTNTDEKISEKEAVRSDSLEDKLESGVSKKGNRSKRSARVVAGGDSGANGDDKARTTTDLSQPFKQGQSESTDAESESTRKRGRKPNSLMTPDEGYSFKLSPSNNKTQEKEVVDSSPKKASSPNKDGQTDQPVVISHRKKPRKRSRSKMNELKSDLGVIAISTTPEKPEVVEDIITESKLEKPENDIKKTVVKSSRKKKTQNGSVKTPVKKPLAETKEKTSGKESLDSDAKIKNTEGASTDKSTPQSLKSKKRNPPSTKKAAQTPKRKRIAEEESNTKEVGEELVGKKVNVWWPMDKVFYEGVVVSYCTSEKMHKVLYTDGESEELNLKKERFEIIQDNPSAIEEKEIDMSESIPLSDLLQRQKGKKRKVLSKNVEPDVRPSIGETKQKDSRQAKRIKGSVKAVSNKTGSKEGEDLKSVKDLSGKPKGRSGRKQKVTPAVNHESEKECDVKKEDLGTKGEASLKPGESVAEPVGMVEHQELPESTRIDGVEANMLKEPTAEPKVAKEPTVEPKTDEEEHKVAEETNAEHETERKSVEEATTEPEAEVEEKDLTADTKLVEKENISEAKGQETGKVENEAGGENDQSVLKELKEESGKEVSTIPGSG